MKDARSGEGKRAGRQNGNSAVNQSSESVYLRNLGLVLVCGVVVVVVEEEDEEEEEEAAS